ncbi:hypothetical protein BKG82_27365 [Mycobacteroides chelonae]|uniref:HTH cro/C1-type domain-containing protein n=1 Tax=Mycobacteroides chelonae TaxID=1774 RepID=A0A1S1LHV0_MYCCH|nr:helix-turn-helix transcriptional regulator [Mycobacteroides chelonae]OHU47369.1 hypothetical protein BKG82_27365 [Mycobacteroides chelonae]
MDLYQLVSRCLDARGETQAQFAKKLGIDRTGIPKWRTGLPKPEVLRAIAEVLEIEYSRVLRAALQGSGYAATAADLLRGQVVHVVDRTEGPSYDRGDTEPVAVFTDAQTAESFRDISDRISTAWEYNYAALTIDGTPIPDYVRVYTTKWTNIGEISQNSYIYAETPDRLADTGIGQIKAAQIRDPLGIYELTVESIDPSAGRAAISAAVQRLGTQDRLLPPHVEVPGMSFTDLVSETMRRSYQETQSEIESQWLENRRAMAAYDSSLTDGAMTPPPPLAPLPQPSDGPQDAAGVPPQTPFSSTQSGFMGSLFGSNGTLEKFLGRPYIWGGPGSAVDFDDRPRPQRRYFTLRPESETSDTGNAPHADDE